jgi:hypothetical protein
MRGGWQMNRHAYRLTQMLGFGYCSTRGSALHPDLPPRSSPAPDPHHPANLDELIGVDRIDAHGVVDHLLQLTRDPPATGHVYTLHAELEGMKLKPVFERLLQGWREQGYKLLSLGDYFDALPDKNLPRHELATGEVPGRSGQLSLQGADFLASSRA